MWKIFLIPFLWYILTEFMRSSHPTASSLFPHDQQALNNQTFVVTGGTSGIGLETVLALTKYGHVVVGSRRSKENNPSILVEHPRVHILPLDLSSIESAEMFLDLLEAESSLPPVRSFVLNGGVFSKFHSTSSSTGIETTYQVNYLTHFHMILKILSRRNIPVPRIVAVVSSSVYWWSTSSLDPILSSFDYNAFRAYADSKASMYRMVKELNRMGIESYAVHPGLIHTSLGSKHYISRFFASIFWYSIAPFTKSPEQGASTQVWCATASSHLLTSGGWYENMHHVSGPKILGDSSAQWNASVELLKRLPLTPSPSSSSSSTNFLHPLVVILLHVLCYVTFFGSANIIFGGEAHTQPGTPFGLNKIKSKFPNKRLVNREIRRTISSAIVDSLYHLALRNNPTLISVSSTSSPLYLIPIFAFWGTTHFYFTHVTLHAVPFLYRHVHRHHHESTNPGPWSSTSFHPIEAIIFYSQYLIILAFPLSWNMWWAFKVGVVIGTLNGHLGYDMDRLGWYGPKHHYHHHHLKNVNFGGWPFGFWDRVMGTAHEEEEPNMKWLSHLFYLPVLFGLIRIVILLSKSNILLYILIVMVLSIYLLMVDGAIYLTPKNTSKKDKVFVIGLSRTGTTSMTRALIQLSYKTYHFNRYVVMSDRNAVDAFDAHTDISVVPIFEQLSREYPNAKFVLSLRDERKWARAMIRFVRGGINGILFRVHPVPRTFYDTVYGEGWYDYDEDDWIRVWRHHLNRVRTFFSSSRSRKKRLLELNLAEEKGIDAWQKLKDFLDCNDIQVKNENVFPHQYVFRYTFFVQPWMQLKWWLCGE